MSWLSKLNPYNWIKEALVSDYVGGAFRHALTALGFWMTVNQLGGEREINNFIQAAAELITSDTFLQHLITVLTGIGSLSTGAVASVKNKKVE